jgi:hypothetical protein
MSSSATVAAFLCDPLILLFAAGIGIGVLRRNLAGKFYVKHPFHIALAIILIQIAFHIVFRVPPRIPFPLTIATWVPAIIAVGICSLAVPASRIGRFEKIS